METVKGRGTAIPMGDKPSNPRDRTAAEPSASSSSARFPTRNASSKYDFVKVKVWLGDNADHYYVLSRFLLSRMLTVTKIPNHVAIKIALELKKLLIDNSLLDVSQSDLEANLFKLMERRGYGEEYISRYKMMTRFHHQRVPLVILVCGTACTGKSTIATQLAQRLNLPNVLQTDMVYEFLRTSTDAPLLSTPVWARDFNSSEELITEFCRECRIVRKGLAGDLKKAMKDGKPIIIEGIHLDPSIYLTDKENIVSTNVQMDNEILPSTNAQSMDKKLSILKDNEGISVPQVEVVVDKYDTSNFIVADDDSERSRSCRKLESESASTIQVEPHVSTSYVSQAVSPSEPGDQSKDSDAKVLKKKQEKNASEPIIVPLVLNMADFDHKALLEEWISTRAFGDKYLEQDQQKLVRNLKTIQDYLCTFELQGLTVVNISATTFPQTLDWLHGYLLQCIERGVSSFSSLSKLLEQK